MLLRATPVGHSTLELPSGKAISIENGFLQKSHLLVWIEIIICKTKGKQIDLSIAWFPRIRHMFELCLVQGKIFKGSISDFTNGSTCTSFHAVTLRRQCFNELLGGS